MKAFYLFPYLANKPAPMRPVEVRLDHPCRSMNGFYEFKSTDLENYSTYKINEHHLTTATIWNIVFPKFMKDFNLDYNIDDYTYVNNIQDGFDLSYHDYNKKMDIKVFADNKIYTNLRDINGTQLTAYHRLFIAPHKISTIINNKALTERIIRLNCDSMIIPLIPLIVPYFKKIYVYDYHGNYKFKETPDITDELNAYISYNFNQVFGI